MTRAPLLTPSVGVLLVLALARSLSGQEAGTAEPPVAGRPANFSGAVGTFTVQTRASPTALAAEDPLVFTIRIAGHGNLDRIPRPDLRKLPKFDRSFQVDDLADRTSAAAREFDYRLRPRGPEVTEIPAFTFVYYRPGAVPARLGYQTAFASAIPLTVHPRPAVPATAVVGGTAPPVPPVLHDFATGPDVLRREPAWSLPAWPVLLGIVVLPPALCAAWCFARRRPHPDSAAAVRRRRSRAARAALRAVRQLDASGPAAAGAAERALAEYLRARFDVNVQAPTPIEVADLLRRGGVGPDVARKTAGFLEATAAVRFGPNPNGAADGWAGRLESLLADLEGESCTPRRS